VLEALALACGLLVVEFMPTALSLSRDSPCFAGFDPAKVLPGADLVLLLDVDVPWLPKFATPDAGAALIHIDVDPLKQDFPMWGFPTDLRLQADCATALAQVLDAVQDRADEPWRRKLADRMATLQTARVARLKARDAAAADAGPPGAISPAWLCAQLGAALSPQDIVVNEAIRNSPAVLGQIMRTEPGTLIGCAGGGLGYSGGMALGARLARPGARVLQVVGDGGFHFSTPTSVYAVAQRYGLPIFTVVLDNGGWQAVKEAVLRVHPGGEAEQTQQFQARLNGEHRHFEQVATAFGAYGEAVSDPAKVPAAIARCLAAVDRGQAAVLNVKVAGL
jgi:acetolactate synthase I/II/III large subunit